jgi:hypothetical protein
VKAMLETLFWCSLIYFGFAVSGKIMKHIYMIIMLILLGVTELALEKNKDLQVKPTCKITTDKYGYTLVCPEGKRVCEIKDNKRTCTIEINK